LHDALPIWVADASEEDHAGILAVKHNEISKLEEKIHREQQEESYIGRLGHAIEPLIEPLGFDWKMGVSLLTGVAAKEVVVSTMAVLYQSPDQGEADNSLLINNIRNEKTADGQPVFTPLKALRSEERRVGKECG